MDNIEAGKEFEIERLGRGDYRLVRSNGRNNEGAVEWLLSCPHKGFFVPVESESTDRCNAGVRVINPFLS